MNEQMDFIVTIQHLDKAARSVSQLLRKKGFKVWDLRESEILKDSDNSYVQSLYLLYCRGTVVDYELYKKTNNYGEEIYEGYRTLIGKDEA